MVGVLVGRTDELAAGRAFLRGVRIRGGALVLCGDPGIGKSTLWRAMVADASHMGVQVLTAHPSAADAGSGYSVLTDLYENVPGSVLDALPEPQRLAFDRALLRRSIDGQQFGRRAVDAAALGVARRLCADAPCLVAVDDVHWADAESMRVLDYTFRRLGGLPVGLLVSTRDDADSALASLLDGVDAGTTWLRLDPMPDRDVIAVIESRLTRPPMRPLREILGMADGNPFFAIELARAGPSDSGLPDPLRDVVTRRVGSLPSDARELLLLCAAAGHCDIETLAAATGRPTDTIQRNLDIAARDGVLARRPVLRFAHPLYAAAIYDGADPVRRRRAHRALAGLLEGEQRAHHLAAATIRASAAQATALVAAARQAELRGASATAVRLLTHAIRLTPPGQWELRAGRRVRLAEALLRNGEHDRARAELELLVDHETIDVRVAALAALAELRYHQDDFAIARRLFESLLETSDDSRLQCIAHLHLTFVAMSELDLPAMAAHVAALASLPSRVDDPHLRAQAVAVCVMARFMSGHGVDEVALAEALARDDPLAPASVEMRPALIAGCLRLFEGRLDEALELLSEVRRTRLEVGADLDTVVVTLELVWALVWRGELERADRLAAENLETARYAGPTAAINAHVAAAVVSAFRGDLADARAHAEHAWRLSEQSGYASARVWVAWSLLVCALQDGDIGPALSVADPILRMVETDGLPEPVLVMFAADAVELLLALGDRARAGRIAEAFDESADQTARPWARMLAARSRALIALADHDLETAWAFAQQTRERCEGLELVVETARTDLLAGRIARRRRQRRVAADLLDNATRSFARTGAEGWHAMALAELDRLRAHPCPSARLTPSEERIGRLAASGLTNRHVASTLGVSPKTVEATLSPGSTPSWASGRARNSARTSPRPDRPGDDEASGSRGDDG